MFLNPKFPNKSRFQKVICALDNWMIEKQVYCGLQLSSNKYAIGSQQDGIVITDGNFNLLKSVNSKNGLQDDFVTSLFEDNSGNLWLSLNNLLFLWRFLIFLPLFQLYKLFNTVFFSIFNITVIKSYVIKFLHFQIFFELIECNLKVYITVQQSSSWFPFNIRLRMNLYGRIHHS